LDRGCLIYRITQSQRDLKSDLVVVEVTIAVAGLGFRPQFRVFRLWLGVRLLYLYSF
jgi:hypothetical protein